MQTWYTKHWWYSLWRYDKNSTCDIHTFGKNKEANLLIDNIKLLRKEHFIGLELNTKGIIEDTFLVNTPGEFSTYNASSAI